MKKEDAVEKILRLIEDMNAEQSRKDGMGEDIIAAYALINRNELRANLGNTYDIFVKAGVIE